MQIRSDQKKYYGKRILILGGGQLHSNLVTAAKRLGAKTYVADPEDEIKSPAKLQADYNCKIDVYDVGALEKLCKEEKIDGVIAGFYHAPMLPYIRLCERMNYPCLCTQEQYSMLNNKDEFNCLCREFELDVPREYDKSELTEDFEKYPIIVKPVDSRGSKGQTVCFEYDDVSKAIAYAKAESLRSEVIIQQYLNTKKEMIIEYVVKDGIAYELLVEDMYYGNDEDGLGRVYRLLTVSDRTFDYYKQTVRKNITDLIAHVGIKNGLCTFQGKKDGNVIRFYDAASRLGGSLSSSIIEKEFGFSVSQMLVDFALSGKLHFSPEADIYRFNGKIPVIWYIILRPGKISEIVGLDKIKENRYYVDYEARMHEGDIVPDTEDVRRILGAVLFLFDDTNALDDFLNTQLPFVSVLAPDGNELVIEDLERIKSVLQHREDELTERL